MDLKIFLSLFLISYTIDTHSFSDFIDDLNQTLKKFNLYNFESGMPGNNGPSGDEYALALSILQDLEPESQYKGKYWDYNDYSKFIPKDNNINIYDKEYKTDYIQAVILKHNEKINNQLLNKSDIIDFIQNSHDDDK